MDNQRLERRAILPIANDAEARVEVATVLVDALTSGVELIDAIDAMEVGVEKATGERQTITDTTAERRERITIVLVSTLFRRRERRRRETPKAWRGDELLIQEIRIRAAGIQLLHSEQSAAEQTALRHEPAHRKRLTASAGARDRIEGGRSEELHRS